MVSLGEGKVVAEVQKSVDVYDWTVDDSAPSQAIALHGEQVYGEFSDLQFFDEYFTMDQLTLMCVNISA